MRLVVLLLMIVLIPVRGWSVEQMGVSMAAYGGLQTEVAVDLEVIAGMPTDCPMLSHLGGKPSDAQDPTGKACPSCQLCMGITMAVVEALVILPIGKPAGPAAHASSLTSADLPQVTKPPTFSL